MIQRLALLAMISLTAATAWGQGQDGTPGERNLQIIAELLPGVFDNANQAYFDGRLALPGREPATRLHAVITRAGDFTPQRPVFDYVLGVPGSDTQTAMQLVLEADRDPALVRMRLSATDDGENNPPDCTLHWRREAGQFSADSDCGQRWQLSRSDLWISAAEGERASELQRARIFSCYIDIPGVAGGRDEPFDRYLIDSLHDQGGLQWLTTREGREIGITLRKVRWPMNNETDAFTRNSLVMYVLERDADGVRTHTYGWTQPEAERIGLNLQWLLVNCYLESNRSVQPYFE